ncbi:MAG TPA: hypothetical protein VLT84_01410, partial [Acidobacteriota bacterium]|nr:hypothetical protein [Acidobacteriota bacterium]
MRPNRDIRRIVTFVGLLASAIEASESQARLALDEVLPDSVANAAVPWIPDRVEEHEAPERLDEPERPSRLGASASRGSNGAVRFWLRSRALSLSAAREARGDDDHQLSGNLSVDPARRSSRPAATVRT